MSQGSEQWSLNGMESVDHLTLEQLQHWQRFYAAEEGQGENIWASAEWLLFKLAGERFILSMSALDEVASATRGVRMPHLPSAVLGLINLRGETILAFDMGQLLGLRGELEPNDRQRLLLFREEGEEVQRTAFLVDELVTVTDFPLDAMQSLHEGEQERRYVTAVTEDSEGHAISRIDGVELLRGARRLL